MAAASGRDAPSLKDQLLARAGRFEFEQAVRLLARLYPGRKSVGGDADPREEFVRFSSDLSPVFPAGDVQGAEPARADTPARLQVRFMGVATPASFGSLPRRYAEQIRALVRDKNPALRDFLDLFNHRLISLFFRARERHRPAVLFERGPNNPLERVLAGVLGLRTSGLANRMALPDRALFARAGLLARQTQPALALRALVESVFGVPAEIEQFRAKRYRIEPEDRNRLGLANARLGEDLFVGAEITLVETMFRVRIGPLSFAQYRTLLPSERAFVELCDLLRFATRAELDFDVQLLLLPEEAPRLELGVLAGGAGRLGWSSWLGQPRRGAPLGDGVFRALPGGARAARTAPAAADEQGAGKEVAA